MALPLNVFKTITKIAQTSPVGIYTAPVGYTGVVLLAQVANIGSSTYTISFSHRRTTAGIAVTTEILKDFPVQLELAPQFHPNLYTFKEMLGFPVRFMIVLMYQDLWVRYFNLRQLVLYGQILLLLAYQLMLIEQELLLMHKQQA